MESCRSRHFEFHTGTKNVQFVEDHLMNNHVQFGFNLYYGIRSLGQSYKWLKAEVLANSFVELNNTHYHH
jgi:hypothetical protein